MSGDSSNMDQIMALLDKRESEAEARMKAAMLEDARGLYMRTITLSIAAVTLSDKEVEGILAGARNLFMEQLKTIGDDIPDGKILGA